jgi:hypothetical protein
MILFAVGGRPTDSVKLGYALLCIKELLIIPTCFMLACIPKYINPFRHVNVIYYTEIWPTGTEHLECLVILVNILVCFRDCL